MRKILIFICCLIFVSFFSMSFAAWTNLEDYKAYKKAKELALEAENAGDTFNAVANYKKAAELAGKSATQDIQIWQYNNAAYFLIKQFKILTGYDEKLQKLSEMKPSKEKLAYQSEIAELFNLQAGLLEEAKELLNEAKSLLKEEAVEKVAETTASTIEVKTSPVGPKEKIESNLQFIDWVENFLKDNLKQGEAVEKESTPSKVKEIIEEKKK